MASLAGIREWHEETDVLVLGFGLAGAVTAMQAIDDDPHADVLILEKMPEGREGGSSRVSGQTLFPAHDVESLIAYQRRLNEPNPIPESLLRVWAEGMVKLEPWIEKLAREVGAGDRYVRGSGPEGIETISEYPDLGAEAAVDYNSTILPLPSGVWKVFREHVRRRRIRIRYATAAEELIQDPDTLVVFGAVARSSGERLNVKARRAVALCTGGFSNNLQMQRDFWGLDRAYALGAPGNTGDGIRMLQRAGAELWHMRNRVQTGGLWPSIKVPQFETAFMRNLHMAAGSWIEIAADGTRFYDEAAPHRLTHYHRKLHGVWHDFAHWQVQPVHMIFDEKTRAAGSVATRPIFTWAAVVEGYLWSADNQAELEKGWITRADSLDELARAIGREAHTLRAAVERYNAHAREGVDGDFGRAPEKMQPIDTPPYYAVEIVPGIIATTGGGRRDERAGVVSQRGDAIPRLYEAGELGSIHANLYQNGSFLTECMVFGRIAGANAVRERPWE